MPLKIIRTEEYGKLRHARCDYGFIAQGARRERKFKSELGGGALLDIGIYNLAEDSVTVLGLMEEIRSSWDMQFTFE